MARTFPLLTCCLLNSADSLAFPPITSRPACTLRLHRHPPDFRLQRRQEVDPRTYQENGGYRYAASPSTRLYSIRGGNSVSISGEERSAFAKASRFVSKNFFLLGMFVAVGTAKLFPTVGKSGGMPEIMIGKYGVMLVFLLSGLSLELSELRSAFTNWKLNCLVNAIIFGAWPLCVGLPLSRILPNDLRDGILILSCLPTTVNMCVILTSAAGGNVASALCNSVLSNMLGIFITPALIFLFFGGNSLALPFGDMVSKLSKKVLLPVAVGQILRRSPLVQISKCKTVKRLQEVILLSILWTAFCASFCSEVVGLSMRQLISLAILLPAVHLAAIGLLFATVSRLGFSRKDVVAAIFCGSQKTLAFGLPLIHTICAGTGANMAAYTAPIMFMHPLQLMLGSLVVPKLRNYVAKEDDS
jgi:solute carrier family 10 (sodium/bile acid cotransporter), member 7